MRAETKYVTVICDNCKREARADGRKWYTLQAHFEVQEYPNPLGTRYTNGGLNGQINNRHYDACSEKCAKALRETLLTIHPSQYIKPWPKEITDGSPG